MHVRICQIWGSDRGCVSCETSELRKYFNHCTVKSLQRKISEMLQYIKEVCIRNMLLLLLRGLTGKKLLCSVAITIKWCKYIYSTKGPQFASWRGQLLFLLTKHKRASALTWDSSVFGMVMVIPYIEEKGCFYSTVLMSFATSSLTAVKRKKKVHSQW